MQIGLMLEGQNGLNWERWRLLLEAADRLGFQCVFRSDHFTNPALPDKDSLELWTSLTYAAGHTGRIEFGPLVAPITFRHPSITAKMAAAVDDLSGGRLVLGIGAGWQVREHEVFGIPFPETRTRFEMLTEYLEVVTRLLRRDEPVTFEGQHYRLHDAVLLPRPTRPGGPPLLIGGNGPQRTMRLAARFADEWNAVFVSPTRFRELSAHLDGLLHETGRESGSIKRSAMIGTLFARSPEELTGKLEERGRSAEEIASNGLIVGTTDDWVTQLRAYSDAGVDRVMLQWLDLDDIEGIDIVAREVLPHV